MNTTETPPQSDEIAIKPSIAAMHFAIEHSFFPTIELPLKGEFISSDDASLPSSLVRAVMDVIEHAVSAKSFCTYYELERHFKGAHFYAQRYQLILCLRYLYLHDGYPAEFWEYFLAKGNGPIEADGIIDGII